MSLHYKEINERIPEVRKDLEYPCDGPVTDFVMIARMAKCVARGVDPDLAANALYEALVDRGLELTT